MKIAAFLSIAATTKVSRHPRSVSSDKTFAEGLDDFTLEQILANYFDDNSYDYSGSPDNNDYSDSTDSLPLWSEFESTNRLVSILRYYLRQAGKTDDELLAKNLTNYGCWCQLQNHDDQGLVTGHGAPVDALDEACRSWTQCQSCVVMEDEFGSCYPLSILYEHGSLTGSDQRFDCQTDYFSSDCKKHLCKCDEQLAYKLAQAADTMNSTFVTNPDGSGFDPVSECKSVHSGSDNHIVEDETKCCGSYPDRFIFHPNGGEKSCCGDVTYNTSKHECCDSNKLVSIGGCPNTNQVQTAVSNLYAPG